jgi:hypothetical protein
MKRGLIAIVALAILLSSAAAQAIWTTNERVDSQKNGFYALLRLQTSGLNEAQVFDSSGYPLWSAWIEWRKDLRFMLSDDGKILAAVDREYTDAQSLVTVYRANKQEAYTTKSIVIGREFLRDALSLDLNTATGKKVSIGL